MHKGPNQWKHWTVQSVDIEGVRMSDIKAFHSWDWIRKQNFVGRLWLGNVATMIGVNLDKWRLRMWSVDSGDGN